MDSAPQQAAVIREGDLSQPRSNNAEVKADPPEALNTNDDKGKKPPKGSHKKKMKHGTKKHDGGNTNKRTKYKSKKNDSKNDSTSGNSSDSVDGSADSSASESEASEAEVVLRPKHPAKKGLGAPKKPKLQTSKKASHLPGKPLPVADSESDLDFSESDSSSAEVDEDESKGEGKASRTAESEKAPKNASLDQDLGYHVAKELQRILQLAQASTPPLSNAALPSHPGLNAGLAGGLDSNLVGGLGAGLSMLNYPLGAGLSVLNYPQASLGALGAYHALAAGRALPGLAQPSRYAGLGELNSLLDTANDGASNDATLTSQAQQPGGSNDKKQPDAPAAGQDKKKSKKLDYKRVDQVWDGTIHNYKLQDTAEPSGETKYDGFCFHVRRTFDWEGKYKATVVDIKSKILRECLQDIIGNIKGISLVDETPKLDPNVLFLYLEDLRRYASRLKKQIASPPGSNKQARKKEAKRLEEKRQCLKVLVKYIDKDYDQVKKSLYPMLEHGLITFDLLWALWKPNTLAYTTTYGSPDEPRVFKVDTAEKHYHLSKGEFYHIDGKYFEYDGKQFGYGHMIEEIGEFRGAKKITSLGCYPLKYHKNEDRLRKELIERGKKFTALGGVHYKSHHGMAYYKKKKAIVKVNVNGRVMVDPSIHRRINPNYPISVVRPKEQDVLTEDEENTEEEEDCACGSDDDEALPDADLDDGEEKAQYVTKILQDAKGNVQMIRMSKQEAEDMDKHKEKLVVVETCDDAARASSGDEDEGAKPKTSKTVPQFTDEEYLIASPVVLGFSFGEKLWLEFTVSGIKDISWNDKAYESLVLEPKTKETVKALVESHKYHAASSIDDVIQGKGKGLVAVLHGPPGTGKTLTAEGISELLKCPLYMVSAGELGTDSRLLEAELQRVLDICHAWGAILLLDEADVFLEKRNMHDLHRNALVSIFLRQLEYFQGILFLTTNRVETFDDAFQSRIHIALRYDSLDVRAKKTIFKMFVERARAQQKEDGDVVFTDKDYESLARHDLNGRQIKNTIIRAQALAVNKGEPLAMMHVRQILDVQVSFDRDLKGGTGYQDAMRSYF